MRNRLRLLAVPLVAAPCLAGCGGTMYAIQAGSAASKVEEAKHLGAEKLAPYEYVYAREHLQEAQMQAAQGDYGDAIDFAEEAEKYADRAIKLTREAHRGAGR